MRSYCIFGLIACLLHAWWPDPAAAQDTDPAPVTTEITPPITTQILWEVKSRFRLFRSEADFQRHVAAHRDDGIFGAEQRLALPSHGRGWARDIVERLCVARAGSRIAPYVYRTTASAFADLSAATAANIPGQAGKDLPATDPALTLARTRVPPTGHGKARAGKAVRAPVRFIATNCARRWRSPSRTH